MKIIIELHIFKLVLVPNFRFNWQFRFFWPDLPKKGFSGLKQKKWTPHIFYIILHIQISLVRNFSSNWQFWFFGPNLPKKVFPVKTRKSEHQTELPKFSELPYFLVVGEGVAGAGERRHYALSSYFFQFLKVSSVNFVVQVWPFKQNYLATVFKVI